MSYALLDLEGTTYTRAGSIRVTQSLNGRDRCTFDTIDETGAFSFDEGDQVILTLEDGTTRLFAGIVWRTRERVSMGTTHLHSRVSAVDFTSLFDRRLIAESYEDATLKEIVEDMIATTFPGLGIDTTQVQEGPTFSRIIWNYATAAHALDELCNLSGFHWRIDYDRNLIMGPRSGNYAPFAIEDDSPVIRFLEVKRDLDQYRNRQYLRAGQDLTDSLTETFAGDGETRTFTLAFPAGEEPTVTVNGSSQTVGIHGVESSSDWYWNKESKEVVQDSAGTRLTSGDTLSVTYRGLFPIIVRAQDEDQIDTRASVQGDDGLFESVEQDASIEGADLAFDKAQALLRKYGQVTHTLTFGTDTEVNPAASGLAVGQLIRVTSTPLGLDADYLISEIEASDRLENIHYQVTALSGENLGGWIQFFKDLGERRGGFEVRENEVLAVLRTTSDAITFMESTTTSLGTPNSAFPLSLGYCELA